METIFNGNYMLYIKSMKHLLVVTFLIILNSSNIAQPKELSDGISIGKFVEDEIDTSYINKLAEEITNGAYNQVNSILISQNNKLLIEKYFNGYNETKKQWIASAAKSFTAILAGIAIDKGFMPDADQNLSPLYEKYQPIENMDERKKSVSLKHMLTMTAGFDCGHISDYKNHCGYKMNFYPDPIKYLLDLPMRHEPGEFFLYSDALPTLVHYLIIVTSNKSFERFQKKYLYKPLGIEATSDNTMTPRSMLKIGLLYLNGGMWNDKQIVSKEWVKESTARHILVDDEKDIGYGYYWWNHSFQIGHMKYDSYYAAGNGGQYIFVIPSLEAVIVFTGENFGDPTAGPKVFDMMYNYIMPAFN